MILLVVKVDCVVPSFWHECWLPLQWTHKTEIEPEYYSIRSAREVLYYKHKNTAQAHRANLVSCLRSASLKNFFFTRVEKVLLLYYLTKIFRIVLLALSMKQLFHETRRQSSIPDAVHTSARTFLEQGSGLGSLKSTLCLVIPTFCMGLVLASCVGRDQWSGKLDDHCMLELQGVVSMSKWTEQSHR